MKMTERNRTSLTPEENSGLAAEAALIHECGPLDPFDTTYTVPHQSDTDRVVEFNLLTVTVDDIIAQCGYPESARAWLLEVHHTVASYRLAHYRGLIPNVVPLVDMRTQVGIV